MRIPRLSLAAALAAGLAASGGAQTTPAEPAQSGVRQDSPEAAKAAIELPEIEYPKPVTEQQQKAAAKHGEGSQNLAVEQDELSADVVGLIEDQTNEAVIQLLEEVEQIMAEVTDSLDGTNTGGQTIAAETEIIEKIFEAAQKRAQAGGGT